MIVTPGHMDPQHQMYEAEIIVSLLGFPEGISAQGIRGGVGRMALSLGLIENLLARLSHYGLVEYFFDHDDNYEIYYYLTVDGWLKAMTLERREGLDDSNVGAHGPGTPDVRG